MCDQLETLLTSINALSVGAYLALYRPRLGPGECSPGIPNTGVLVETSIESNQDPALVSDPKIIPTWRKLLPTI